MSAVKQILAFRHTIAMVSTPDLKKETEYAKAGSKIYYEGFLANKQRKAGQADIIVEEDTSFSAAKKYMCFGKTAVLNFANPKTPGGDVKSGAMAQEECLCLISLFFLSKVSCFYKIMQKSTLNPPDFVYICANKKT